TDHVQLRVKVHAIGVLQRYFLVAGIIVFQHTHRLLPILVALHGDEDVGLFVVYQLYKPLMLGIELVYVARNDFHPLGYLAGGIDLLGPPELGIPHKDIGMVNHQAELGSLQYPKYGRPLTEHHPQHKHDHLEHQDLELEELRHPEYPVLVLHKGQHAEQNQHPREDYEGHSHLHHASGIQSSENFLPQNISYICGTSNTPYMIYDGTSEKSTSWSAYT